MQKLIGRDFSNESFLNILLRLKRAISSRVRGRAYAIFGLFSKGSSHSTTFGLSPKFMNSKWIYLEKGVSFGNLARVEAYYAEGFDNSSSPKIKIGENTSFGDFAHIGAINKIVIGKNVLGGSKIIIIDHDHGKGQAFLESYKDIPPRKRELVSKGVIIIHDNVWIGEGAIILAGSEIGEGAIIAANSIVNGFVAPFKVYINGKK